jgi:hypothetical protein
VRRSGFVERVVATRGVLLKWPDLIVEKPVRAPTLQGSSLRENLHPILLAVLFLQKDRLLKLLKDHLLEHLSLVLGVGFGSLIDQTFETEINLRIPQSARV